MVQAGNEIDKLLANLPSFSISPMEPTSPDLGPGLDSPVSGRGTKLNHSQSLVINPMEEVSQSGSVDLLPSSEEMTLLLGGSTTGSISTSGVGQSQSMDSETMILEDNISECNSNSNSNNSVDKSSFDESKQGQGSGGQNQPQQQHRGPRGRDVAKLLGVLVDRLGSLKRKVIG